MQIIKKFSVFLLSILILVPYFCVISNAYNIVEDTGGTQIININNFTGSATLTSDAGPNTQIQMESTYQETANFEEYTNQFYRFVYKTGFKPSSDYYAYKITIAPTVNSSTFTNIPFYRPCVGTFDQLLRGEGTYSLSFTQTSTLWYVTNSNVSNIYFSIYMLCNDINRIDKSNGSVTYMRPFYDFDVDWKVTLVPYSYEDYIGAVLTELESHGDDLQLILSYLQIFDTDLDDLYTQLRYVYLNNETQATTQIGILNLIRDTIIPTLESIESSLNATPSENADFVQENSSDEFSSVVSDFDGGSAVNSLPNVNVDTTSGGFKGFKTIFTYLMADIPELLTALTLVLTLGFIGYVLGRKLNKGG